MILPLAERLRHVNEYYFSRKLEQLRQMRYGGVDVINLGIGSPDLAPSETVIEAATRSMQAASSHGYAPYRSSPELRQAIAKWYARAYGVTLDAETQVLPLLGSKEGLFYISQAFLNPGDGVLVPDPGYPAYASTAHLAGARIVPYRLREENGWLPDLAALEKTDLNGVKIMWVNYPHMPTGAEADESFFARLIEFGRRNRILICHDNPYGLVLNSRPPLSLLKFDPQMDVSLELNSLSKSFNMAGWRIGMLLSSGAVVNAVLQVKSNVDSGMFTPLQAGAIAALQTPDAWHESRNFIYRERQEAAEAIFTQIGFRFRPNQVGLFVWAKAPEAVSDVEAHLETILQTTGVFLTPGFIFGDGGRRYARCSLCAPLPRLQEALQRIKQMNAQANSGAGSGQ